MCRPASFAARSAASRCDGAGAFGSYTLARSLRSVGRLMPNTRRLPKPRNKSKSARANGLRVGMADDLVRVGGAAINDRPIAVGLELLARRVLGGAQRGKKLLFIPRAEQ